MRRTTDALPRPARRRAPVAAGLALVAAFAIAATPDVGAADLFGPPAPATRPAATAPADRVARMFADLADASPATREAARIALMGLDARDLPTLERVVRANLPLDPAQAVVL